MPLALVACPDCRSERASINRTLEEARKVFPELRAVRDSELVRRLWDKFWSEYQGRKR